MRTALIILCLWVAGLVDGEAREMLKCVMCGKEIEESFTRIEDLVTHEKKVYCLGCADLPNRCFTCDLPLKEGYTKLHDGRLLCARDGQVAVSSDEEAKAICRQVKLDLDRLLSRF